MTKRLNQDKVAMLMGIIGVISLSLLTWYGIVKTGESNLWQPMSVPIVVCLLMIVVLTCNLSWQRQLRNA